MIHYTTGDATEPNGTGTKIIAHIVNDVGVWGAGFVVALSKKWNEPEVHYRCNHMLFSLGENQLVSIDDHLYVCNMFAQRGVGGRKPLAMDALESCLCYLRDDATEYQASVHMPRIGCGLGGGSWDEVGPLIERVFRGTFIPVTIYDLMPVKVTQP